MKIKRIGTEHQPDISNTPVRYYAWMEYENDKMVSFTDMSGNLWHPIILGDKAANKKELLAIVLSITLEMNYINEANPPAPTKEDFDKAFAQRGYRLVDYNRIKAML